MVNLYRCRCCAQMLMFPALCAGKLGFDYNYIYGRNPKTTRICHPLSGVCMDWSGHVHAIMMDDIVTVMQQPVKTSYEGHICDFSHERPQDDPKQQLCRKARHLPAAIARFNPRHFPASITRFARRSRPVPEESWLIPQIHVHQRRLRPHPR